MADVFISYQRQERARCELIHDKLFELGFSVWFDAKQEIGQQFDREIENEASKARCVLVLWSPAAAASLWVRSESTRGLEHKKLAAAFIEKSELPMPFNMHTAADLTDFDGDHSNPAWLNLIDRVAGLCGRPRLRQLLVLLAGADANGAAQWAIDNHADPLAERAVPWVAEHLARRTATRLAELGHTTAPVPAQRDGEAPEAWRAPPVDPEHWREEEENWRQISDSIDYRDFDSHRSRFPTGRYADAALRRASELMAQ